MARKLAMIARRISMFGLGLALTPLLVPSTAWGQGAGVYGPRTTGQQPAPVKQELHGKGEFEAASGGVIKAVLDGKPWYLKFDKTPTVKVTGTATADFLAPGIYVRFKADLDKRGKASAPVTELDVFTPDAKNPVGATTAGGAFADAPKKGPASATPTPYTVAGRITAMHKGSMTVACNNMTVKADVAPEATIKIEVADPSWAASGDKIEVKGYFLREGYGMVTDLTIDIAAPLTGPKKKTVAHKPPDKADPLATGDKKSDPKKGTDPATDDKKVGGIKPAPAAGDAKPDATKPDTTKPDAVKPDAAKPDAAKPDAAKPDAAKPDAAKPDAKPDAAATDTSK